MTAIEQLLSQPLTDITDNGFSDSVLARIKHYQRWRQKVFTLLTLLLAALLYAFFPVNEWLSSGLKYLSDSTQLASQLFSQTTVNNSSTVVSLLNSLSSYSSQLVAALLSQITIITVSLLFTAFGFLNHE